MTREQLEAMDDAALRDLINLALEVMDKRAGDCTDCHGDGRYPGDEEFDCDTCNGTGKAVQK